MKLNNRGWGLQAMLLCVLVLMIALVIVAILVNQLGKVLGIETNTKEPIPTETKLTYTDLENRAVEGAKKYQDKYYSDILDGEKITVTLKTLRNQDMIEDILDIKSQEKCTGYVIFTLQNEKTDYYPYLKCDNYTTKGYLDYLDI